MLKSRWMLLVVIPAGFLLVAAVAAFGPAQSTAAAAVFAGLAALAFVVGGFLTFGLPTHTARPSVPRLDALRRFARQWLRAHSGASEAEARAALARRFGGTTGVPDMSAAMDAAPPGGNPGDQIVSAGLAALLVSLRQRFFPVAPARPADIELVLGELRAADAFGPGLDIGHTE